MQVGIDGNWVAGAFQTRVLFHDYAVDSDERIAIYLEI